MLALVHPQNDVSHRTASSSQSVTTQLPQRPPPVASTSRKSAPLPPIPLVAPAAPPSSQPPLPVLHRHQTAPSVSHTHNLRHSSSSASHQQLPSQHPPQHHNHHHQRLRSTHTPRPPTPTPPSDPISSAAPVDIHTYPTTDLLKLLASLLTQIASTNDQLASSTTSSSITTTSSTAPIHLNDDTPIWRSLTTASRSAIATPASTLTFHARNIPTITLEAYFLRILKYCPTTNEVFLALLVYFDRMSKLSADATGRTFVIDSYNIHRLVIAGVTVASKFFSDVFYTNSRYAKVGGLPLPELNQLELQFLLLNDFRLVISSEEMQKYAEQLILFSRSSGMLGGVDGVSVGAAAGPVSSTQVPSPMAGENGVAAPMSAMGAIDAYGGKVAEGVCRTTRRVYSDSASAPSSSSSASSSQATMHVDATTPAAHIQQEEEEEEEAETETEDGDEASSTTNTTDDEPTIRAASVADRARRRESIDEVMVMADAEERQRATLTMDNEGERTPETQRRRRASSELDERMSSP